MDGLAKKLGRGVVHALLPARTSEQKALQFDVGGVLPAEPAREMERGLIQEVPTSVPTLAKIVAERIASFDDPVLWVHEPLLSEGELDSFLREEIRSAKVRLQRVEGQLYLAYGSGIRTEQGIAKAIDSSMLSWHFLAFVTDGVHHPASVVDLLDHSIMVLVGAYDGESALIWERRA